MSATEEVQRDCAYCRQPITLKWENGPMPSEDVRWVFGEVYHDKCWNEFFAVCNEKPARPRAEAPVRV